VVGKMVILRIFIVVLAMVAIPVPVSAEDFIAEGYRLLDSGRPSESVAAFGKALEKNPDDMAAHEGMTWAYQRLGDHGRAVQHADRRLSLAPADVDWARQRALILFSDPSRRSEALSESQRFV
jgi:tetratricopeptide (TPR) repeat protein